MISLQSILVLCLAASALPIHCAGAEGAISGVVTDQSGAAIPSASVLVRGAGIAAERRSATDDRGVYEIAELPAGAYELAFSVAGFQLEQRAVTVVSGAVLQLDVQLKIDARSETVVVSETSVKLDPAESQVGQKLLATQAAALPVNGRGYTDLLALQPGVMPVNSSQPNAVVMSGCTAAPPSGDLNPGNLSVSGQRETANGFSVNGSSVEEDFNMGSAVLPNLDSILEMSVLTANFAAEYGKFSGAQVLVSTKSGGNQLHGSAFDFLRNTSLDARNYFSADRAAYNRNQFGGTLGGPIRRNQTFFFADYQGARMKQGIDTGLIAVPSLANHSGDFSANSASLSGAVNGPNWAGLLSQKLGYSVQPGEPYYTRGCDSPEQCVLPNAQIPQRAWSAAAKSLLPYIPLPNAGPAAFSTSAYDETLRDDKAALRIDSNTPFGSLSAYYFADDYSVDNPYPTAQGGANVPGFNALNTGRAQLANLSLTTVIGPSSMNDFRIGYLRTANNVGQPVGGVGPSLASQGFTGIVAQAPKIEGIENVAFSDFTIGVDTTGAFQANNSYQASETFSKSAGAHLFKLGAAFHSVQININPNAILNGSFLFQGTETGSDFADFLLGIPSSYAQGDSQAFYLRNQYAGAFAQDSYRVTSKLTLNYGIRWDLLPAWREKYNQLQTLVPGEQSVVYPGAPRGLVFPGDPGIPSTLAPVQRTNFAPRLGLAWSPDGKTSLHAGYGVFYTAIPGLSAGIMSANPPYGYDYDSVAPPLFETPFVTAATGDNLGQRFPEPIPAFGASASHPNASVDWSQYLPITGVPSFYRGNVTPYSESYTLSVEREVAPKTFLNVSYVGTQAHHLLVLVPANPGNPALCLSLSRPEDVMPGTATCGPFGESGVYITPSGQTVRGTRGPFNDNFAAVTYQKTIGNSNYNSLELLLRRSARSLDLALAYTYGKSLDQSSSLAEELNPLNGSLSKSLSAFDMRHNFAATYNWKLPFGLAISGVTRFTTGLPVTLYNNEDTSLLGTIPNGINNNGVDTPDVAPGPLAVNTNPRNGRPAFDTRLFQLPALGQLGTANRRYFYGPGMANFDAALHKSFRFAESRSLELRIEAFNVLNHAQFYGPAAVNGNIASSSLAKSYPPPRRV